MAYGVEEVMPESCIHEEPGLSVEAVLMELTRVVIEDFLWGIWLVFVK